MLGSIEKFLFETFPKMPKPVRVFTYLFLLFLFAYLLLIPKFVNGQLVVKKGEKGTLAYRGGELRQHVEGRVFSYKVNEDGYWSVPVVSMLPHAVEIEVYNVDADAWFPVKFDWLSIWKGDAYKLEVASNPDRVQIIQSKNSKTPLANALAAVAALMGPGTPEARAGVLVPRAKTATSKEPENIAAIRSGIIEIVSAVMHKDKKSFSSSYRLTGSPTAPSYVQRIEIINMVERRYAIKIPDEHWTYIFTINELADYVAKKKAAISLDPENPKAAKERFKFLR